MNVLVLGGNGMAGHMVVDYLKKDPSFCVKYTTRHGSNGSIQCDARNFEELNLIIDRLKPDYVINCIGVLNKAVDEQIFDAIVLNSLLPHHLTKKLEEYGGKLIHISTDCVFSGLKGNYIETDPTDGQTLYAKTKALGEINHDSHLTIRTSIIGPETKHNGIGLLQWFLKQEGTIKGFKNVWWNGVTTLELAKFIHFAMKEDLSGLCHFTAREPINKYQLLVHFQHYFMKEDVDIVPDFTYRSNKILINSRQDFYYETKDFPKLLEDLRDWMSLE